MKVPNPSTIVTCVCPLWWGPYSHILDWRWSIGILVSSASRACRLEQRSLSHPRLPNVYPSRILRGTDAARHLQSRRIAVGLILLARQRIPPSQEILNFLAARQTDGLTAVNSSWLRWLEVRFVGFHSHRNTINRLPPNLVKKIINC